MSRGCCKCSVAWWRSRVKLVTVEPILFLYMFAAVLSDPTQQALVYHKVCLFTVPDANNTSKQYICDNLENETNRDVEKEVQTVASHWFLYIALCFEIPSILIAFTYGSLSDHFSRKVTLVAPVIGQMIAISNWIANSMYPEAPMGFLLIGPLISGCFGGWVTLLVGCMSYISDISTRENRTGRIAVAEFVIAFPISLGLFISGAYRDATNVQTVFSTTLVLYFFVILYTVIRIKEPEGRTRITATWKSVCVNVLSPMSIKNTFKTVFRKREFNRRKQLAVLFLCLFLGILSTQPSWSLAYLYTKKYPLSWSTTMYGINAGYTIGIKGLANLLINPLLKKRCKMRDTSIMIMSLVTNACGEMLFGFSTHTWMVFMVPIVSIFGDAKITCQRALMSTMVESSELGQMFAIFGSLQSASNLVASFTYQYLYPLTLNFWSGFCFFMGASLSAIPLGLYIWVHRNIKKMEAYQMTDVNSSEEVVRDQDENGDSVWTVSTDREGASAPEFDLSVGINMKKCVVPRQVDSEQAIVWVGDRGKFCCKETSYVDLTVFTSFMTRQTSSDSPGGSKAKKFLYTGPKKKGPGGLFDDETAAPIPSYGNVASPSTENVSDIWKNISLNTTPRAAPKPSTQEGWSRNVERGFYSRHGMMAENDNAGKNVNSQNTDGATTNPQQQSQQPQQSQQQQTFSYSNSNNTTLQQSNSNSKFDVDKKNVNNQNIYAGGRYGMQHRGGATNGMQYRGGTNRPF